MRTIKFRVRDLKTKKIVGYEMLVVMKIKGETRLEWACSVDTIEWNAGILVTKGPAIREQYTGLNDKTNIEVYEADVLNTPVDKIRVVYKNGAFFGEYFTPQRYPAMISEVTCTISDVIGNIYTKGLK